ncbi:MAG: 4,5-DOPA dioxygenase extradiol [Bacteroidia bacterium]|nr:4,5-DOPA dioxygenase extradiol [Bacteroidia bacterium]
MDRKKFIGLFSFGTAMTVLGNVRSLASGFPEDGSLMPVLFVGHGSPMNGIEDNEFSARWKKAGTEIPRPAAVLCISAHWLTRGTWVTAMDQPKTIHDFGGFPQALYDVQYPAPGNAELAGETAGMVHKTPVGLDHEWGLDHGTWSVVRRMYPSADIPVLQMSIDHTKDPQFHYELGSELYNLRKRGVLIIGSGNMVHNLRMIAWEKSEEPEFGYDWALQMNETFKQLILKEEHNRLVNYQNLGAGAGLAIPTPDHYLPLLYILGLKRKNENQSFFNDKTVMGSVSMTSVRIG